MNASVGQGHSAEGRRYHSRREEVPAQLRHHPSRKPSQTPTLYPPKPSLLQSPRAHSLCLGGDLCPLPGSVHYGVGTSSDSSLCLQNAAGISYATCSANEHLSTLKPEKLLEPLLTRAVPELGPPSPIPQEHAINGQHTSCCPKQSLDYTNQLACTTVGVGSWGPQSVAINSPALKPPPCSDFSLSHPTRQGRVAFGPGELWARTWPGDQHS